MDGAKRVGKAEGDPGGWLTRGGCHRGGAIQGDGNIDVTMVDLTQDGTMDVIVDGDGGHPPVE